MERRDFFKKSLLLTAGGVLFPNANKALGNIDMTTDSSAIQADRKNMKIVVLTGSPRRNGNSAHLAERFIKGATEAGHEIFRFDCAFQKIESCTGCHSCEYKGPCVFRDDFDILSPHLISADMVVFVSPMYYFGISSQLKRVIDRFNGINFHLKGKNKKTAFMLAYSDTAPEEAEPMLLHYKTMTHYLGWTDVGTVVAPGVWEAGEIEKTGYGEQAYQLGRNL